MPKKLTTEDFIIKSKEVHNNRYVYTNTKYVNKYVKVEIECRIHGLFSIFPQSHYKGGNCPKCAKKREVRTKGLAFHGTGKHAGKSTFKTFSKKFDTSFYSYLKTKHKNKYKYDTNYYSKCKELDKIPIQCKIHGVFWLTPKAHMSGQGCGLCNKEHALNNIRQLSIKASSIHNNKYIVNIDGVFTASEKVSILCKTCNKEFSMTLQNHAVNKQGCPYCRGMYKTINEVKNAVKDTRITIVSTDMVNTNSIIEASCSEHGTFFKPAKHFLANRGCPTCSKHGFDLVKPAILYYLSINNGQAYKIGITNRTVKSRFDKIDLDKITILREWHYQSGIDAFNKEKEIIEMYKEYKYTGSQLLKNGNTEMFKLDILGIDINLNQLHQCVA